MSSFRDKLEARAQSSGNGGSRVSNDVKVINMQSKSNYGTLVFVPIAASEGTDPVGVFNDVMQVAITREGNRKKDNSAYKFKEWITLLNREDYPDMTAEELEEYKDLRSMGKKLNGHKFSKSKKENDKQKKDRIRFKSYTVITGWIIEHKDMNEKTVNKNCPAVLIFSSARFDEAFSKALKAKDKKFNGPEWQTRLFNASLHRKMYLSISYHLSEDPKKIGYIASVDVEKFDEDTVRYTDGNENELDLTKYEDKVKLIKTPSAHFLGHGGKLYSAKSAAEMRERLHELLNKYCGTDYPLAEGKVVERVETHDPLKGVKSDDSVSNIKTDKEKEAESSEDNWD